MALEELEELEEFELLVAVGMLAVLESGLRRLAGGRHQDG
jgi:hypothetical protein